jgi:hypothetical protein
MKILGTIDSLDFSEAEKARLGLQLADPSSKQRAVIASKALLIRDNDFWRKAQKNFQITGFRDGTPLAKQKVLTKALESTKVDAGRPVWLNVGPIYIKAVRIYVEHDVPNLYQLLRNEDFVAGPGNQTEQIFRCICRALPIYEATTDEARELYELWGFERTPQIDEILSSVNIRADDVRRMVAESISTARREIADAVATTRSDVMRSLERHSAKVEALAGNLQRLKEATSEMSSQVADLRSKAIAAPNIGFSAPPAKAPKKAEQKQGTQDEGRTTAALDAMQGKVDSLSRQLRDQRVRIDALEPKVAKKSGGSAAPTTHTTPRHAIEKWLPSLGILGISTASLSAGWLLLQVLRRTRVVITDKPEAFSGLWKLLASNEVKQLAVSPLWVTELDWKAGLEFLSEPETGPRLLVLFDFDVAIQESYLIPALIGWLASQSPLSANRILLVPSNSALEDVSPRVFELALLCSQDAHYIRELERLSSTMKDLPPTLDLQQSPSAIVGYEPIRNSATERELRQYVSQAGVQLPNRVAENFISLYEGLQTSLSATNSALIAQGAALLPWVRASRGETVAKSVQNAFSALYAS